MKKILVSLTLLGSIIAVSSCDYDDSNDIDLINPTDTTTTNSTNLLE